MGRSYVLSCISRGWQMRFIGIEYPQSLRCVFFLQNVGNGVLFEVQHHFELSLSILTLIVRSMPNVFLYIIIMHVYKKLTQQLQLTLNNNTTKTIVSPSTQSISTGSSHSSQSVFTPNWERL